MKNGSAVGSAFEISLRILLLLNALPGLKLDEEQIGAIDFISVYAADFGLMDENLHGYSDYRFGEYPARRHVVAAALRELVLDRYILLQPSSAGYKYSISESGKNICAKLTDSYAGEYILAVHAVAEGFGNGNTELMLREINSHTMQSLKEVGHE